LKTYSALAALLAFLAVTPARAQSPSFFIRPVATPTPHPDSAATRSWSHEGAAIGGVAGGLTFGVLFFGYTHRTEAPSSTVSDLGGAFVGAAIGAAGGALFGAFVGSLFPKH